MLSRLCNPKGAAAVPVETIRRDPR